MNDDSDILRALDDKVRFHLGEAQKYKDAASLLRSSGVSAKPRSKASRKSADPKSSTMAMISIVLDSVHEPISPANLVQAMLQAGWKTASEIPENTVRTALRRMLDKGTVSRTDDGRYLDPQRVKNV